MEEFRIKHNTVVKIETLLHFVSYQVQLFFMIIKLMNVAVLFRVLQNIGYVNFVVSSEK